MAIINLLAPIATWIIARLIQGDSTDAANKKDYINFLQLMDRAGVKLARRRLKALSQKSDIADQWAQENINQTAVAATAAPKDAKIP